jgi:hypothetical protein
MLCLYELYSSLGPRLIPLYTWMDLLFNAGEVICESEALTNLRCLTIRISLWQFKSLVCVHVLLSFPLSIRHWPVYGPSVLALTIPLGCLLPLRVLHLTDAHGRTFFRRADILASSRDVGDSDVPGDKAVGTWNYFIRVTIGVWLCRKVLP